MLDTIRSDGGLSPASAMTKTATTSTTTTAMPPPNYVDPPTRPPAVMVIDILLGVLVTVSLVLRLYTNGYMKKRKLMLDDLFATVAMFFADASFIIQIVIEVVFHQNRHTWDIPPHLLYEGQKWIFIYDVAFSQAVCQSKLSLLFFVHKMIRTAEYSAFYPHYICLITLIVIVALCQVLFVIFACVSCHPLKAFWDPHPTYPYSCFNINVFFSIDGIVNTLTDFLCTILPAFIVFKLQMPFRRRMGVASLFLGGIVVNIASALRIYYTYTAAEFSTVTRDIWRTMPSLICGSLELGLGSLCINLPIIRPFLVHYGKYAVSYMRSRSRSSSFYHVNRTSYHADAYGHARRSNAFVPVGDHESEATASLDRDGTPHRWRGKASVATDTVDDTTVELNLTAPPSSRKGTRLTR